MTLTFLNKVPRKILALLSLGFLLAHGNAYGQKEWTLKECVDYALQHNLTVKQQYLNSELARTSVDHNKYAFAPTLNGSASSSYNWGRSVDPFSYQFTNEEIRSTNLSLSGDLLLFNGFQVHNTLKQSKLDYMASKSDLEKIQNDISLNVVSAYLQVLFAQEQLKVFVIRVDESSKQRNRTKLMVDAGTMTRGNLLDAESQLATEELNKVTAESQLATARLTMIQLMELDSVQSFSVKDPMVDVPAATIMSQSSDQIYTAAMAHLPEIKAADLRVQSAGKGLNIARGSYLPRFSMFGSYSSGYSSAALSPNGETVFLGLQPTGESTLSGEPIVTPVYSTPFGRTTFGDQLSNNLAKSLGVSLSIPLFNGFNTRYNVSRAKISVMEAELNSQLAKKQVYKSIQQAYTDAYSAQQKFAASQKNVDALEEANQYADKRFNAGLSSSLEFLTATNNLTRARTELLQAKYDYIFKLKILDFYAGNPLNL